MQGLYQILPGINIVCWKVFQGEVGDSLLFTFRGKLGGGWGRKSVSSISEGMREKGKLIWWESKKATKIHHECVPVPLWHNTFLPLEILSIQTAPGMHIHYPSIKAMSCHGEWRRATEQGRARASEHRGLDSAIYKAWPSACLINCALFWESRKPAGLQERGRQSQRKRKKKWPFSLRFISLQCLLSQSPSMSSPSFLF